MLFHSPFFTINCDDGSVMPGKKAKTNQLSPFFEAPCWKEQREGVV